MLPGATDRLFLHFCRTGSARSLGRVFDRTAPELLRVAIYLSGNRADADDLVQRTFLTAIESRASYDPERRAVPWLLGILVNLARRLQRERATRRAGELPEPRQGDDPAVAASNHEITERITRLRGELGEPYAAVLALHFEGLNAKEIALRLGRPAGTVRTQLMRALEKMRRHLPAGFVGALKPPLSGLTDLAEIKTSVLAANNSLLPAGASTAAVTIATGGVLMSKKLIAASAGLLLFAAGVYTAWPRGDAPPSKTGMDTVQTAQAPPVLGGMVVAEAATRTSPLPQPGSADAADAEPGFGAIRVIVRWQDGRPAAGVGVRGRGLQAARNERRIATTGADGSCLLQHLRPEPWEITTTHDDARRIEVRAAVTELCEFTATSVATARGRVVDDQQRPVAAADICITLGQWEVAVGLSDADGCFALPLCTSVRVGARKAGFTPSLAQAVDPKKPVEDLVLALRGRGGHVEGTVRDSHGQPIAWARVLIGMAQSMPRSFNGPYQRQLFEPGGAETATDAEGRFVLPSVEPGREGVQAWAPGYAIAQASVDVTAGVTTCNLTLIAGGVVQGQVRDAARNPIGNAFVRPSLNRGGFVDLWAGTDADGRYRLVDLSPGQWLLVASSEGVREAETIEVTAGATAEWNPVLRRVDVDGIRGRVLGADGRPLVAETVSLCDDGAMPGGSATVTDADGAFVLQPKHQGLVNLRVGDWKDPPLLCVRGVRAGMQDIVIRLTAADVPSAYLRGRVVDERGAPIRASIMAGRVRESQGRSAETAPDGRFELGPLSPGTYFVRLSTPALGSRSFPKIVLEPQGEHDFGELVMQAPGSAVVDVRDEQGKPARAFVHLNDTDAGWVACMNTEQGRATFPELQPGRYFVTCGGAPTAACGELEVQSGVRAFADLQMVQVGHADVAVRDPSKVGDLDLRVFVFRGGRFAGMFSNDRGESSIRVWLPPGSYSLEVRTGDGRCARGEVTIRGLDDHPQVTVELPAK